MAALPSRRPSIRTFVLANLAAISRQASVPRLTMRLGTFLLEGWANACTIAFAVPEALTVASPGATRS